MAIAVILFRHSGYISGVKRGYKTAIEKMLKSTEDEKYNGITIQDKKDKKEKQDEQR